jgi:hypothetical protein
MTLEDRKPAADQPGHSTRILWFHIDIAAMNAGSLPTLAAGFLVNGSRN